MKMFARFLESLVARVPRSNRPLGCSVPWDAKITSHVTIFPSHSKEQPEGRLLLGTQIAILFIAGFCGFVRAEDLLQPAVNEKLLDTVEADKALNELAERFKATSAIKAHMVTERDDPLGKRKEEGELLLERPDRMLRKFNKPLKIWLLSGTSLKLYIASRKTIYVTDFSKAPKALQLVRAAMTVDVKGLTELFDVHVFKISGEDPGYRLVLTKKEGANSPGGYKLIQGRIGEKALFFSQIDFVPEGDASDRSVERYTQIEGVPKLPEDAFKLEAPPDVKVETETINAK